MVGAGYNTPEEYQMGWITPLELDGGRLTPGATVTASTPALTRSSSHGVRIVPTWCARFVAPLLPSQPPVNLTIY